jgi:hypothetical protein
LGSDFLGVLQLEFLNLLLVLCSTQLFRPLDGDVPASTVLPSNLFIDVMMKHHQYLGSSEFVRVMLQHFIDEIATPKTPAVSTPSNPPPRRGFFGMGPVLFHFLQLALPLTTISSFIRRFDGSH